MPLIDTANAFIELFAQPVRTVDSGSLAGLTFAAKDNIDVEGRITGNGNPVWRRAHGTGSTRDTRPYSIEFHRRLSFPAACLVLMLVGVPLGLSSKRGGKGTGFAVTLLLVFLYYFLSEIGVARTHADALGD